MTEQPQGPQVFFSDGIALNGDDIVVAAGFTAAPTAATSRIYLKFGKKWLAHEVPDDFIVSVAHADGVLFGLGRNGLVKTVGRKGKALTAAGVSGKFSQYTIADSEARGQLTRVRAIGAEFYACGWGGQVYRLAQGSAQLIDQGIDPKEDDTLLDMDGASGTDMYAAGLGGVLLHFDGSQWTYLDSPTNNHLFAVKCLARADILLCGAHGGLYRGNRSGWKFIGDAGIDENFWSICKLAGSIYIAYGNRGLFRFSRGVFKDVSFGLPFKPRTHRLDVAENLWSFGSDHILELVGKTWHEAVCPDNE
jgi:hypothetical protein